MSYGEGATLLTRADDVEDPLYDLTACDATEYEDLEAGAESSYGKRTSS